MPSPRPGQSARGVGSGRRLTSVLEFLGRRWMLRVLWELGDDSLTFRVLRARCDGISPSVLNRRISELREAGIVEPRSTGGYRLTEEGRSLLRALRSIGHWAKRRAAPIRRLRRVHSQFRAR
ncbi:MAG TPA: helix-turn-helix domain-containing protein [Candidatus Binatia bacterium]|nr:helix-turn-helix domain-containing protein [Candidatus Binatia bacterium]